MPPNETENIVKDNGKTKVNTKHCNAQEVHICCRAYVCVTNTTKGTNMDLNDFCQLICDNVKKFGPPPTRMTAPSGSEEMAVIFT